MKKKNKRVYILYGVTERDKEEVVCMFFEKLKDVRYFKKTLPGTYELGVLRGIKYDDIDFEWMGN